MEQHNFPQGNAYIVDGLETFDLSTALRLWKAKYTDFKDFNKEVLVSQDFNDFVQQMWDDIQPVTVEDALAQPNAEVRRIYFSCIGTEKLFKSLDPKLLDRQVVNKKRYQWDDANNRVEHVFEDVYELYEIEGSKLFEKDRWGRNPSPAFAVRCWCTTTNREYWLYVNEEAATGHSWLMDDRKDETYDAIRAIAWTIRVDVKNVERIYRQGDIVVAKTINSPERCPSYHLTKDQYLSLMYSET